MAREMKDFPSEEKKLEQYGVWVKVEPMDFSALEPAEEGFKLTDLETGGESPQTTAASDGSFTKEEEDLLDELETDMAQEAAPAAESEELVSMAVEAPALEMETLSSEAAPLEEGEVLPELELDELDQSLEAAETVESGETQPAPDLMNQDVLELPDEAFLNAEEPVSAAEEALPAEIPLADQEQGGEVDVPLSEESPNEEHFDDLAALEEELATVTTTATEAGKAGGAVSGEILARIEAELKSLRSDLTELKKELTVLKRPAKAAMTEKEQVESGFFDEDEDETIALTGDELDNILSTAEITEGQAEGTSVEEVEAGEPQAMELVDLPESAEPVSEAVVEAEAESPVSDLELESLGIEGEAPAEAAVTPVEEDLELEPLESAEEAAPAPGGDLELELESLPELTEAGGEAAQAEAEPVELESLEEEAPAAAEEAPVDLESIPEFETAEVDESLTKAADEAVAEEIDLEELSPEGGEEVNELPSAEPIDLETAELEALPEVSETAEDKGIEIAFEDEGAKTEEIIPEAEEVVEQPKRPSRSAGVPDDLKDEIRTVLKYMDQLLEALPEEKIQEFASSEYFVMYKKLFEDLGLGE